MAERVRLRLQNAEEVIAKAKEQVAQREQELQALRAKGQPVPSEASLLGCWQTIEKTFVRAVPWVLNSTLGDHRLFLTALAPDGQVSGHYIEGGGIVKNPFSLFKGRPTPYSAYEVTGKIMTGNKLRLCFFPINIDTVTDSISSPQQSTFATFGIRFFSEVISAEWKDWEMEGNRYNDQYGYKVGFKAVKLKE